MVADGCLEAADGCGDPEPFTEHLPVLGDRVDVHKRRQDAL